MKKKESAMKIEKAYLSKKSKEEGKKILEE